VIDDALRKVSLERGVRVRVLASLWNHTKHDMSFFLRSLADVSGAMKADIQVVSVALYGTQLNTKVPSIALVSLAMASRPTGNRCYLS